MADTLQMVRYDPVESVMTIDTSGGRFSFKGAEADAIWGAIQFKTMFRHSSEPTPGGGEREAEHEAFERWADEKIGVPRNGVRKALADIAREAWSDALAWQAARLAPAVTLTSEESEQVALTRKYIISLRFDGDHIRALLAIIDRITGAKP